MKRILPLLLVLAGFAPFEAANAQFGTAGKEELVIKADNSEYNDKTKEMILRGHVVLSQNGQTLSCDDARYNSATQEAVATGNVVFEREGEVWRGARLTYNFATAQGDFGLVQAYIAPYHIDALRSKRIDEGHYQLEDVTITTCDPAKPEFYVHADSADVFSERIVRVKNAVSWLNGVPVLWLPSYTIDPEREATHFDVIPGYSSRDGAFVLTAYTFPVAEEVDTTLHLDYRANRGVAGGADLSWKDREEGLYSGKAQTYYASDDKPYRNAETEERLRKEFVDIEQERYRLKLNHFGVLSPVDTLYANAEYLSDPRVVRDFFDDDYRINPEPETRLSYAHNDTYFNAGLELNRQLNADDFDSMNRQPEAFFNFNRMQIGDSGLYYESQNSAGLLERTYSKKSESKGREEYDTERIHTSHRIYYPTRHFDFLNLIPRVGYTGTYYGDTFESRQVNKVTQNVATNGVVTFTTNKVTEVTSAGADIRNLPELGFETSFKAFKVIHDDPTTLGKGLRHVVEPFTDLTYVPEPDLRPAEIYQFDAVDKLDRRNDITVGLRNKFQTKIIEEPGQRVWDYVDATVYGVFNYDPQPEEETFQAVGYDVDLRPVTSLRFDSKGEYSPVTSELLRSTTQAAWTSPERSTFSIDHLYRVDRINALQLGYSLWPKAKFSLEGYSRFELEDSTFEEQALFVSWQTACVGYGVGVKWIVGDYIAATDTNEPDDWQVWGTLWLTAMPKSMLQLGR
ncbi:MAG: LPS assembly protein LptD [Kiritimatiellia bacterium]